MTLSKKYMFTRLACYMTNISMAAVGILSPLLFETFREKYHISYSLLGLLVVVNFGTQLAIDLIFTVFSHKFNIKKTVILMPLLTFTGLMIYAIMPMIFSSSIYIWLVIGTVIFSISAGLCEVLISPIFAAMPSENPEREMSKLHSVYAWGLVGVVLLGSGVLKLFELANISWHWLAVLFSIIPFMAFLLFLNSALPSSITSEQEGDSVKTQIKRLFNVGILLCFTCIFFGGAAEGTMTQWISSYMENVLRFPKILGDVLGMAMFAVMLALGRSLYAKFGRNILNVMIVGMIGSVVCYVVAGISTNVYIGLIACVLTGICTAMLWPGNIILIGEKFPTVGVAAYALMAVGGDMGCSIGPQLMGIITDTIAASDVGAAVSKAINISTAQLGMRAGLLVSAAFPIIGLAIVIVMKIYFSRRQENK